MQLLYFASRGAYVSVGTANEHCKPLVCIGTWECVCVCVTMCLCLCVFVGMCAWVCDAVPIPLTSTFRVRK